MTVTRTTVWVDGNTLTAAALNGEFNNLLNAPAIGNSDIVSSAGIALSKLAGSAQGAVPYDNGSSLSTLAAGTSGQFLQTQGAGANPIWSSVTKQLQSIQNTTTIVNSSNNTTSDIVGFSLTFTPSAVADILVIASINWYNGGTGGKNLGDIQLDGSVQGLSNIMQSDQVSGQSNVGNTVAGHVVLSSVSAVSHTITCQFRTSSGGNAVIQAGSLICLVFNHT